MSTPVVGFVYRNFRAYGLDMYSHVGLGINAQHTVRVLREHRIPSYAVAVWKAEDIFTEIRKRPYTHIVIEALWVTKDDLNRLAEEFQDIQFCVRSHSQIGFLQIEPGAVKILRDSLAVQEGQLNVKVAGNSRRFEAFVQGVYNQPCALLPNLYDLPRVAPRPHVHQGRHRVIRIASFGALRHLKMHSVAAAGALLLAERRGLDLEFHVSVNREEHGSGVLLTLRNMFAGLPWAKLVEDPWQDWGDFRRLVAHMDLCIQVSATETFNLATADAIAEGVPCVVSTAIDWTPPEWQVDTDDAEDVAKAGWQLLTDDHAPAAGQEALKKYLITAVKQWKCFAETPVVETV